MEGILSQSRRRQLAALLILLPLFVLIGVYMKKRYEKYPRKNHIELQRESLVAWEKLRFVDIGNIDQITKYLQSIKIEGIGERDVAKREKLVHSVALLINAFKNGSFESYLAFRLPDDSRYQVNERQMSIILANWQQRNLGSLRWPTSDLAKFEWWVRTQSGGDFYKGFWRKICIDSNEIFRTLGRSNKPSLAVEAEPNLVVKAGLYVYQEEHWHDFGDEALYETFNAGVNSYPPTFYFSNSPKTKLGREREALAASVHFFAKPEPPDPVLPVSVRYFWDSESENWLPIDFAVGNLLMQSQRSFVF